MRTSAGDPAVDHRGVERPRLVAGDVDVGAEPLRVGRDHRGADRDLGPRDAAVAVEFRLATIWQAKGHAERAVAGYEAAIGLRPDYLVAHLELGQLLLRYRGAAVAIAAYRRAVELNPHDPSCRQKLRELLERQGNVGTSPPLDPRAGQPHLLRYTDCSGIGGAEQCNHALLTMLAGQGYRATCAQGRAAHHLIRAQAQLGVRHLWLEDDTLYDPARSARALADAAEPSRILAEARPDLVVFSDGAPPSSLMAKEAAQQLGIPHLIVAHCATEPWADRYASFLDRVAIGYRHAAAVIAVSQANLGLLRERFGLPAEHGRVIYYGRPATFFATPDARTRSWIRHELGIPPEAVLVCTVASMEMRKGYGYLLKALKELRERSIWPRLYFGWVGTGTLEPQLRAAIEGLGVQTQVRFLGERADVADVLAAADIFALTSQYEGMPLAVMEAMARGLPVVASAVSGVQEEMGDTGRLLSDPQHDPQALVRDLVATICAWSTDAARRHRIGLAGRRCAELLFTQKRMLADYLDVVIAILPSGAPASPA